MKTLHGVKSQLAAIGFKPSLLSDSAVRQLPGILDESENIEQAVHGRYEGGYALLVATNRRMLFLDKKIMSFRVEDYAYYTISEIEYRNSPFMGHLVIHCRSNTIHIQSAQQRKLRMFARHLESRLNQVRADYLELQQYAPGNGGQSAGWQNGIPQQSTNNYQFPQNQWQHSQNRPRTNQSY